MDLTQKHTEDYALVKTDALGTMYLVLETDDPEKLEQAFKAAVPLLTVDDRLDAVRRTTEVVLSAVGVEPE